MGFDLEAKNPDAGSLHLDAGKWSMLRQVGSLCNADIACCAGLAADLAAMGEATAAVLVVEHLATGCCKNCTEVI